MDNTRKNLIELIGSVQYGNGSLIGNNFQKGFIEKIADHLIANGVTLATDNNVGDKLTPTNADRIRAMSDKELGRFLAENEWECETYNDCVKCPRMTDNGCVSLLKWLQQPVGDDDG